MNACFSSWMRSSHLLSAETLAEMIVGSEVLEQDERGYKVIKLSTGDILKIFRVRHKISTTRIHSNARRFCRNAERLQKLGVNTVRIQKLYHFKNSTDTAVLYSPLAGSTLKKLLDDNLLNQEMASALGVFVARLHQLGIHFRSLHMGNILITPAGEYGLIDVSDMKIYLWPLFCNTRARNFKHLTRYHDDMVSFGGPAWECLKQGYFANSKLSAECENKLRNELIKFASFNAFSDI
jgi:tRNA A-37 threonylcarbamoyl transferase component Bud32